MTFMLPIIMNVFQNRTEPEYQAKFKKPCEFNDMINMFSTLPPYFNEIGRLYPNKTDLIAYYSMQLSSTFLVNQGSLTMDCLYNMLDLQSRLGSFAIGILDHPEKYEKEVGNFGLFMKAESKPLRNNAMLQILEYVDKYEKNNDKDQTVALFSTFNVIFVIISIIGILANFILILVLKHSSSRLIKKSNKKSKNGFLAPIPTNSLRNIDDNESDRSEDDSSSDNYRTTDLYYRFYLLSKRYRTRMCLIIISICHLFYLKINFIIMSQFKLAAVALGQLNKSQFGCKMAFFLFPPTSPYNILHQLAIWFLIYALYKHFKKIRKIKNIDESDDYLIGNNENELRPGSLNRIKQNGRQMNDSCLNESSKNIFHCVIIFGLIVAYNAQNLFLYSINEVTIQKQNISLKFCAFNPFYSNYYVLINQTITPMLNLFLFVLLPMILGILYLSLDLCLFIRLKREQNKLFKHLREYHIEWLLYVYFIIFLLSQMPLFIHQLFDIITQNIKFPFVFPLFIGLIFSKKVGLVLFEMGMLCIGYSIALPCWCLFDNDFINIIKFYFNKYILCRTLKLDSRSTTMRIKRRSDLVKTNSLIYKKNGEKLNSEKKNKMKINDDEENQFSTSTTSTNDDKIDVIEKFTDENFKMIDDDKDLNLYQISPSNRFRTEVKLSPHHQIKIIQDYENTENFLNKPLK
jgi:hypothetical protein